MTGLVRAARPRPPRHRDRQLRHAPPDVQPRRLPAQLRARRQRRPGRRHRARRRARRQGAPRVLHDRADRRLQGRHDRHRRPRAGAAAARRPPTITRARGAVGVGVARDPLRRRPGGEALGRRRRPTRSSASTRRYDLDDRRTTPTRSCASRATARSRRSSAAAAASPCTPFALTNPIFLDANGNGDVRPADRRTALTLSSATISTRADRGRWTLGVQRPAREPAGAARVLLLAHDVLAVRRRAGARSRELHVDAPLRARVRRRVERRARARRPARDADAGAGRIEIVPVVFVRDEVARTAASVPRDGSGAEVAAELRALGVDAARAPARLRLDRQDARRVLRVPASRCGQELRGARCRRRSGCTR